MARPRKRGTDGPSPPAARKRPIEQYDHKDKTRPNNPPVGLVTPESDRDTGVVKKAYAYDPHLDPQLVWAGKAEHTSFELATVSLHVHERIDPKTVMDTRRIALWMLDTDYDGRSLYPRQVFFPMADENGGWARLARNLKAEIDEERIQAYCGAVSLPFEPGEHKRVAVKIVDDRGIESLKVVEVK